MRTAGNEEMLCLGNDVAATLMEIRVDWVRARRSLVRLLWPDASAPGRGPALRAALQRRVR
jgi:hypothetical protein